MSLALSFAGGFLKTYTAEQRAKLQAQRDAEKAKKEKQSDIGKWIVENADKFGPDADFQSILAKDDYDYTDFVPLMNTVNEVGSTINYGSVKLPVVSYWEDSMKSGDNAKRADAWYQTHLNYIDKNGVAALQKEFDLNPAARIKFSEELAKYEDAHNIASLKNLTNKVTGRTNGFIHANTTYARLYDAVNPLLQNAQGQKYKGVVSGTSVDELVIANAPSIENPESAIILKAGPEAQPEQLTKKQMEGLNKLVALNPLYKGDAQKFVNDFVDIIPVGEGEEATIEGTHAVLLTAIEFANSPNGYAALAAGAGGDEAMRVNLAKDLTAKFGSDRFRMAQTVALLVSPSEDGAVASSRITYSPEMVNQKFEEITKAKPNEVKTAFQSGSKLQAQLNIVANSVTVAGTTGFVQAIQTLGIKMVGEGGQLDQIFTKENIADTDLKKGTSVEQLENTARSMGFLSAEKGTALARAEAAKISLAMAMARAADPSGRLSNQDFETQLRKLGSGGIVGDSIPMIQAKLKDIAEEFGRDFNRVKVMNSMLKPGAKFGRRELRLLYADAAVQEALDLEYAVRGASQQADKAALQPALPENMIPVPENFQPADQLELPTADGQGSRTMVFSTGAQGMPSMGWYTQTEQGLVPATDEDIMAIQQSGNM